MVCLQSKEPIAGRGGCESEIFIKSCEVRLLTELSYNHQKRNLHIQLTSKGKQRALKSISGYMQPEQKQVCTILRNSANVKERENTSVRETPKKKGIKQ